MVPMHSKIEGGLSMNLKKVALIFNDLRDLTPHPGSLSPLRGEGAAIGHPYYFVVLGRANPPRFMGGGQVRRKELSMDFKESRNARSSP